MNSRAYYDLLSGRFLEQNEFWNNLYDNEIWNLEHTIMGPHLTADRPLVDVGSGFYPHDGFAPTVRIIAADISYHSLLTARAFCSNGRPVEFLQFDAHQLPFREGSLCQVIAGGEILNEVDYRMVLKELGRTIRPGGVLLVAFAAKWCLDSLWAIADTYLGHRLGYALTKSQVRKFLAAPRSDAEATWPVAPSRGHALRLLCVGNVLTALSEAGFRVSRLSGTNCFSGLVPLPWQQNSKRKVAQRLTRMLLKADRFFGRLYPFYLFAGNVFIVCRRASALKL